MLIGAATGIGAATARRLAAEGAAVTIGDINDAGAQATAAAIESAGGRASAVHCDFGDGDSIAALMQASIRHFGRIDALVNVALANDPGDTDVLSLDPALFDRYMQTNLKGYLMGCRLALPHLLERGGAIVQVSSLAAQYGGAMAQMPLYAMFKAGVDALTRHIAARYGKRGVRCNSVAPGLTMTELIRATYEQVPNIDRMLDQVPRPRFAEPEEMAGTIAFLLSADAGAINGLVITADGGQSAVMFPEPAQD